MASKNLGEGFQRSDFAICANEITYRGIHFATIDGKAWPTLKADAQIDLLDASMADLEKATEDAYERGERDGADSAESDAIDKLRDLLDNALDALSRAQDELSTISADVNPDLVDGAALEKIGEALEAGRNYLAQSKT